jgi:hypothetical protein
MALKNFLQNLFKGKNTEKKETADDWAKNRFEAEVQDVVKRYRHDNLPLSLKDQSSGKPVLFAEFYPDDYNEWLKVKSLNDRRKLIYGFLDKLLWDKVSLWEKAERLIEAREALKAKELFKESPEEDLAMYYATYAKLSIVLHEYDQAIIHIMKGLEKFPDSKFLKIQMADYYYSVADSEKYDEVMKDLLAGLEQNESSDMNIIFDDIFSYHYGKIRSVSFAVNLGFSLADPDQAKIFWDRAESEFYFHPVFRLDHARYILENRDKETNLDTAIAMVKYYALLQEMPWQKEAAVNTLALMESLGIKDEKYNFVKDLIDKNGW